LKAKRSKIAGHLKILSWIAYTFIRKTMARKFVKIEGHLWEVEKIVALSR